MRAATLNCTAEVMGSAFSSQQNWQTIPALSVTNFAEHLATGMRRQHGLKPEDVIWIEHYPEAKDRRKESFDLVRFAVVGDTFRTPVWTRITEQAVDELIAGKRTLEDLIPRRVKEPLARQKGLGR